MNNYAHQAVEVKRIIRRSDQGITLPFLCEAADGRLYWAKGNNAGRRALCCEWVAGCLARDLELPLPPFAVLHVPEKLISQSMDESMLELGAGIVFGSQDIGDAQEIGIEDANRIMRKDPESANLTLIFDWWVQNSDRILGEKGGNPNILISVPDQSMRVIDHNIAFDRKWDARFFFDGHIFSRQRVALAPEWLLETREKLRHTYKDIEGIWQRMPEEWKYLDSEMTMPVDLTLEEICGILSRVETEWDMVWK